MPEAAVATGRGATAGAIGRLAAAGVENPSLDAQLLLADALGITRAELWINYREPVPEAALARFSELVERREAREPMAYILGRKAFRHIELAVDPRVLIPRPETELLVDVGSSLPAGARVLDLGTGCGAVALALKDERPDLELWGSDVSADALTVARVNAERLGLEVQFVKADLLEGLRGPFDAVLANPPYVAADAELPPEISSYEPAAALFAGPDGLDVIRRLVDQARAVPLLALEIGFDQSVAVSAMLRAGGFSGVELLRDLGGHERVAVGRR